MTASPKLAPAHRPTKRPVRKTGMPKVDLALQGGGSHGAFTWGVLDALLEDGTLEFDGISGTSAGALNAAVLACGWADGGREGARRALTAFWTDIATCGNVFAPLAGAGLGGFNLDSNPWFGWVNALSQQWSPYQFNPSNLNPLRDVLVRHVRDKALHASPVRLFITATTVRTGQPKVFSDGGVSIEALLASACLPQLFQAVQIDGEAYWDGGFVGNPALWPLIYQTDALDIVLVQLDPLERPGTPKTAVQITDRLNEITFNAGLVAEMRAIAFVKSLIDKGHIDAGHYKDLRMHRIADDAALAPLDASSKYNTDRQLLAQLFHLGRAAAQRWLVQDRHAVGHRSSFDIEAAFLKRRR
jgi:NTE family protein